jgi:hypothetical protein
MSPALGGTKVLVLVIILQTEPLISITDIKQHQKQIGIDIHLPMGPQEGEE